MSDDKKDDDKKGKKFRVLNPEDMRDDKSKYDGVLFNIFAAYCYGRQVKEIAEIFDIPITTFYYLKKKYHWEEKKKEYLQLTNQKAFQDMINTRTDLLKMSNAIANAAGAFILKKVKDGKANFSVRDFSSAVRTFLLLSQESDQPQERNIFSKEMLEEISQELNPEERGLLLEVTRKIQLKLQKDKEEKLLHLA